MKLLIKEIKEDKDKPWNIITTMFAPNKLCKTCQKNIRKDGSAYCIECTNLYKSHEMSNLQV